MEMVLESHWWRREVAGSFLLFLEKAADSENVIGQSHYPQHILVLAQLSPAWSGNAKG